MKQSSYLQPIPRILRADEVAQRITNAILKEEFKPGERLPAERELARALGVGRTSVREALKSLNMLGLIEVRSGFGTYVRLDHGDLFARAFEMGFMVSRTKIIELIEARRLIEVGLAHLAAQRRTPEDLEKMENLVRVMEAADDEHASEFLEANLAFHLAIAEAARNKVLLQVFSTIRGLLRQSMERVIRKSGVAGAAAHRPIFTAIQQGDAESARAAMEEHLSRAKLLVDLLPEGEG